MRTLKLTHCVDYDKFGVPTSSPETLLASCDGEGVTIGIGVDQLTRKTYTMTAGEARRLAAWLQHELDRKV